MKKLLLMLIFILPIILNAQMTDIAFKIGYYTPYDLKSGFMYSMDYGIILDRNISLLIGADLYYKSISNEAYLDSYENLGVKIRKGQRLDEWTGVHLPILGKIRFEIPVEEKYLHPYVYGGVGYGFTHVSLETYDQDLQEPASESFTYHGVVWQVGGGIMFQISRFSNLLFEIGHNYALFEKEEDYNLFTTLNSSGFMFKFGIDIAIPVNRGRRPHY